MEARRPVPHSARLSPSSLVLVLLHELVARGSVLQQIIDGHPAPRLVYGVLEAANTVRRHMDDNVVVYSGADALAQERLGGPELALGNAAARPRQQLADGVRGALRKDGLR